MLVMGADRVQLIAENYKKVMVAAEQLARSNVNDKISDALKMKENQPMHLVAFLTGDQLTGLFIVCDMTVIKVPADIMSGVHLLMVAYYVFDVEFPRMYRMFLGILQVPVIGEPRTDATKKFHFFLKKLRTEMVRLSSSEISDDQVK